MDFSNIQIPRIKISIRVIAVFIALIGFAFLYWISNNVLPEIKSETASLTSSNTSLTQTEINLSTLYNNMTFYLQETERLNKETDEILSVFPSFMYLEDKILYADTLLKTDFAKYNISDFTYGQSNYVTSVTHGDNQMLELYSVGMNCRYTDLSYMAVKNLLDYGLSSSQRFVITNFTISFNEQSGYLNGDIAFKTYFMPGQEKPYEFPDEVVVGFGDSNRVNNLFGSRQ
jgi:hypothetical protein